MSAGGLIYLNNEYCDGAKKTETYILLLSVEEKVDNEGRNNFGFRFIAVKP